MTPNQTDDVIAGYRKGMDAQQQIVAELRDQMRHMVRLDDPVLTGLVDELSFYAETSGFSSTLKALSAYEARVKEVGK